MRLQDLLGDIPRNFGLFMFLKLAKRKAKRIKPAF
jgi:hypothetical protein